MIAVDWSWLPLLLGVPVVFGALWVLKRWGPADPDPWHDPEGEGD